MQNIKSILHGNLNSLCQQWFSILEPTFVTMLFFHKGVDML
jgi:hypothetical protein